MKLITALGIRPYDKVKYRWNGHECGTSFVQQAFVEWFNPETTCVLLTSQARNEHWSTLRELLHEKTHVVEVDIPEGKSEEELWEIFKKISDAVDEGEEVIFDITHGFRSLPMVALLTIA